MFVVGTSSPPPFPRPSQGGAGLGGVQGLDVETLRTSWWFFLMSQYCCIAGVSFSPLASCTEMVDES